MIAILTDDEDLAACNIRNSLIRLFDFKHNGELEGFPEYEYKDIKLYTLSKETIYCEHIDEKIDADLIVFATQHASSSGKKTLCIHSPGNWNKNELGGEKKQLCIAPAQIMKKAHLILSEKAKDLDYDVTLEVTHHGPLLLKTPCFFIEIGSEKNEWEDKDAGEVIAKTIIETLTSEIPSVKNICLGIGGGHYAPYFTKISLKEGYCFGHNVPKYAFEDLDLMMILQAINRTVPKVNTIVLDWKGMGPRKREIIDFLEENGLEYVKARKVE